MKQKWHLTIFVYFLIVLAVPFCSIIILTLQGANLVKKEAIKSNQIIIEHIALQLDQQFQDFNDFVVHIQNSPSTLSVLTANEPLAPEDRYNFAKFSDNFETYFLTTPLIESYLIYFEDQEIIFNPNTYKVIDAISENEITQFFTHLPSPRVFLDKNYNGQILPIYMTNTTNIASLLYADTIQSANIDVIIKINLRQLDNILDYTILDDDALFVLTNKSGEIIYYNNQNLANKAEGDLKNNEFVSLDRSHDYFSYQISSATSNYNYFLLLPSKKITGGATLLNLITLISIVLFAAILYILIRIIKVREYQSIGDTISLLNEHNNFFDDYNAFQFINNTVTQLIIDKKKLEITLESSERYLQTYFLNRLITSEIEDRENYTKLINYHNLKFNYSKYRVAILYANTTKPPNNIFPVIMAEIEQLIDQNAMIYEIYLNGMIVFIINYDQNAYNKGPLMDNIENLLSKLDPIKIIAAASDVKDSYFDLYQAYNEAMNALEQCLVTGLSTKEYQSDSKKNYTYNTKYYQYEKNFQSAITDENYKSAQIMLKNMTDILTSKFANQAMVIKCKLYGILNILMSMPSSDTDNLAKLYDIIETKVSVTDIADAINIYLDQLDNYSKEMKSTSFTADVEQFVSVNYKNSSLSVSMVADNFGISLSVMSKKFKKECGINISDYIHIYRIKQSKDLLLKTKFTIKQIAEDVGYLNSDVFIRVFKRYEGITPGKYRKP
ncbi:helix-turn-helix transcriptional regulator [Candidatus Epulonipiscium viviparus]|uniref:helix-turn-helix transcriptional regulator n=1 Tax=Candidatus Epulonipiscium viviparus TaxID=420336 RepID=UPI002738073C|nr:helix-turn-helix transcriptional regulator [Candidatus Epulopiscium viviparus]